jgi:hypothetical protein
MVRRNCLILRNRIGRLARRAHLMKATRMPSMDELAAIITRHAPEPGMYGTALPRLSLFRVDKPTMPIPSVYEASLCLIAQGAKRVSLGDHSLVYDASRYLIVSVDLPLTGHIIEAAPDRPYLCCKIDLDIPALADLSLTKGRPCGPIRRPRWRSIPAIPT